MDQPASASPTPPVVQIPHTTVTLSYMDAYAPLILGNCMGCLLLGSVLIAAYNYFSSRPNDHLVIKLLLTVSLRIGTTVISTYSEILLNVLHPGDALYASRHCEREVADLKIVSPSKQPGVWTAHLFTNLTAIIVQGFMTYRTITFGRAMRYSYGKSWAWLVLFANVLLILGVTCNGALGLAYPLYAFVNLSDYAKVVQNNQRYLEVFIAIGSALSGSLLAVDLLLTVVITAQMRLAKTGFAASTAVLDALVAITFRNGLMVSLLQLFKIICYNIVPLWTVFFTSWSGHVYCLTLLSILTEPKRVHTLHMQDVADQERYCPSDIAGVAGSGSKGTDVATASSSSAGGRVNGGPSYSHRMSMAAGSSVSGVTMVGSLRCRSCGCSGSGKGMASPVMTPSRRDDALIGFHAALMDLDEASNERDSPRNVYDEARDSDEEIAPSMDLLYDDPHEPRGEVDSSGPVAPLDTRVLDHGRGASFEMSDFSKDKGLRIG